MRFWGKHVFNISFSCSLCGYASIHESGALMNLIFVHRTFLKVADIILLNKLFSELMYKRIILLSLVFSFLLAFSLKPFPVQSLDQKISISMLSEKTDPAILDQPTDLVTVIVKTSGDKDSLASVNSTEVKAFQLGDYYQMKIIKSDLLKLQSLDSVEKISPVKTYNILLDYSVPLIGASSFWNASYNGSGIKICVLDTGINKTHPAFGNRVIAEKDFTSDNSTADLNKHGTHVAGIAASSDSLYTGVAPGALLLNAKVCDSSGSCADPDIMNGIDWCVSQKADILTMSFGGSGSPTDTLSNYVDLTADKGKTLTIAAGNSGSKAGTISCPGCAHKVITVGSTQSGKSSTTPDKISSSSSRGPTSDNRIKPDLVAPGEPITSAKNTGGWVSLKGTSMSAPHVAGLSALLLQARPSISIEELKALLMDTANDLGTAGKDNDYGAGRVNATRAFQEISNTVKANITNSTWVAHNIYVPPNSSEIRATLYWPENSTLHSDLDFYLADPAGYVQAFSESSENTDEMLSLSRPLIGGNWKLSVHSFDVNGIQPYVVASNFKPSGQMFVKSASMTGIVYHRINVTSNSTLIVNADWNSSSSINLYLYDSFKNFVNSSAINGTNSQTLSIQTPTPGVWLAKLVPASSNFTDTPYTITSTFQIFDQTISPALPTKTSLFLNGSITNLTAERGSIINITSLLNTTAAKSAIIEINSTPIPLSTNQTTSFNLTNTSDLLGAYNITAYLSDDENFTFSSATAFLFIRDTIPPSMKKLILKPLSPIDFQLSFSTSEKIRASLEYGASTSYGYLAQDNLSTSHTILLPTLNESTQYFFRLNLTDIANNPFSLFSNFTTGSVKKINTTANTSVPLSFSDFSTSLDLTANDTLQNISLNLSLLKSNPIDTNLLASPLNKYLTIEADDRLKRNLSFVIIKLSYTDQEISGLVEDNLRLYLFNSTGWVPYDPPFGGVNKTGKFVWANRTGFSTYALAAKQFPGLSIAFNQGSTITQGTQSTTNCSSASTESTPVLSRNNVPVSNPETATLSNGTYSYSCAIPETDNFVSGFITSILTVNPQLSPAPSPSNNQTSSNPSSSSSGSSSTSTSSADTGSVSSSIAPTPELNQILPIVSKIMLPLDSNKSNTKTFQPQPELLEKGLKALQIETASETQPSDSQIDVKIFDRLPIQDDKNQTIKLLPSSVQKPLKFFQFTPSSILKEKIKSANLTFTLQKSEIPENGTIAVLRFANGEWTELPAIQKLNNDGSTDYTSTTPGFSFFVLAVKQPASVLIASEPANQTPVQANEPTQNATSDRSAVSGLAVSPNSPSPIIIYSGIIIISIIAISSAFFYRRKSKNKEEDQKPLPRSGSPFPGKRKKKKKKKNKK